MKNLMAILKALADESRVRIFMALAGGELCVCQIVELMGLAPSTISKHMFLLKQANLLESRKQGRWMFYRLAENNIPVEVRQITALITELLAGDPQIRDDAKRLKQILKLDKEELCRKQNRC